jgi:hypothetical protein
LERSVLPAADAAALPVRLPAIHPPYVSLIHRE